MKQELSSKHVTPHSFTLPVNPFKQPRRMKVSLKNLQCKNHHSRPCKEAHFFVKSQDSILKNLKNVNEH